MERLEIEGKTIDEAIEKACAAFGVAREKLNIEILEESTSGFLGIGARKARIRAGLLNLDINMEPLLDDPGLPAASPKAEEEAQAAPPPEAGGPSPALRAKQLLEGILQRMHFDAPVTMEETADRILLNIQGDGNGLLIGRQGQNIDALQYVVNKAVHRSGDSHRMIVIDAEDYRRRREESLVALARRLGDKVKKTKKPVTIGNMTAHDRRIIHLALHEDEELATKSRGEGDLRKILILPARRGQEHDPKGAC